MKTTLAFITILLLATGCKKAVVDPNPDPKLIVETELNDVSVEEGTTTYSIDISTVFRVAGATNALITKSVFAVQNPSMVSATINGEMLELSIHIGQSGASEITLRAEYAASVVYEAFTLTVNGISASAAMNNAVQQFQSANYSAAENLFRVVLAKNNSTLHSDAYMGLGFSQMRLNRADEAYQSLQMSQNLDVSNRDAQAGLSLLEYAFRRNFTEAIRIGNLVLTALPDFVFRYDNSLDKNDVRLNVALAQFSALQFNDCLANVQMLDPTFVLTSNDPDFQQKLAEKLQVLISLYS